jgi:hypothetical protein
MAPPNAAGSNSDDDDYLSPCGRGEGMADPDNPFLLGRCPADTIKTIKRMYGRNHSRPYNDYLDYIKATFPHLGKSQICEDLRDASKCGKTIPKQPRNPIE